VQECACGTPRFARLERPGLRALLGVILRLSRIGSPVETPVILTRPGCASHHRKSSRDSTSREVDGAPCPSRFVHGLVNAANGLLAVTPS